MTYPQAFYIGHKLFTEPPFQNAPVWGDICDGPQEHHSSVVESVLDTFRDEAPTPETLRVWFCDGIRVHDMTAKIIDVWHSRQIRLGANARLIAHAPDLLEALEEVLDALGFLSGGDHELMGLGISEERAKEIRATIAKAKGGAE